MKKRFLVTGGAGFIGSHLVTRLISEGHDVTIVDNLATATSENINKKADFLNADISKPGFTKKLPVENIAGVFHLAGQSSGEISFEDPQRDFNINVGGTLSLLEWCKMKKIKRFIFTSTMGVYGSTTDAPISEDTPCRPKSFYGVGKFAAENYINIYSAFGIESTIIRPFNVYGPAQNLKNLKQGMASIYMSFVLKDEPIVVKGGLDRFRDQTYVKDVIDAMMLCLENPRSIGKTYNVATGKRITVKELIDTMLDISGKGAAYSVKQVEGTPGDLLGAYADVTKIKKELGWESRYSLKDGLKLMYDYYVKRK